MQMARFLRLLLRVAVFLVAFIPALRLSWLLLENLSTRDFSLTQDLPAYQFAVLVRRTDRNDQFAVDFYPGIGPESKLVTEFSDTDIAMINSDLRTSASDYRSRYEYFKVLRRGTGFVDVSLEAPTAGDSWRKNSYRIEGRGIHPQRQVFFGPLFGLAAAALASVAGIVAVVGFEYALRRRANIAIKQPPGTLRQQ
jgi:hypothetical protein